MVSLNTIVGERGNKVVLDPQKIEKEGLVNGLGWKCTLCPVCRHTSDWLLISILMCVYNHTFCYVLESCKHQVGKIRMHLQVSGSTESSNWLQKVQQLLKFLAFHSVHFYPTPVWFSERLVLRLVIREMRCKLCCITMATRHGLSITKAWVLFLLPHRLNFLDCVLVLLLPDNCCWKPETMSSSLFADVDESKGAVECNCV